MWDALEDLVNQKAVDTFKSTAAPTCTFTPTAGGGPFQVPTIETEFPTQEPTSSGSVTILFIYLKNLTALSAPLPVRDDTVVWKSVTYKVTKVTTDLYDGVRITLRKA